MCIYIYIHMYYVYIHICIVYNSIDISSKLASLFDFSLAMKAAEKQNNEII